MTKVEELELLLEELRGGDTRNQEFTRLVGRTFEVLGEVDRVISEALGISRTTVLRWRVGSSIPHPLMREPVYRTLSKLVTNRLVQER